MKIPGSLQSRPEAVRAVAIVEELEKGAGDDGTNADVFAAFEELDALPPDVVRAVLTAWKGPPPDPEKLDAATRLAHGFPPPPLALQTVRRTRPARLEDLGRIGQEQLRKAGTTWDGLDLPAADRLRLGGGDESESSFAGTIELRTLANAENKAMFDLVLYRGDSGAIFLAGSSELAGAIAYGVVEMSDRRARLAVQGALSVSLPHEIEAAPVSESQAETEREPEIAATPAAPPRVVVRTRAPVVADADEESALPTMRMKPDAKTKKAAPKKKSAAAVKAEAAPSSKKKTATSKTKKAAADEAPATKKKPSAAAAAKVAPAKKKTAEAASKAAPAKKKAAAAAAKAPAKKKAAAKEAPAKKATPAKKKAAAAKAPAKKKAAAKASPVRKKTATKR